MIILYALLGLLSGAVLNLAADHLPQRHSILNPPRCPYCQEKWALVVDNLNVQVFAQVIALGLLLIM